MGKRVNTAQWIENQKRWRIAVQKDGVRKYFYSSTPGRNGQRECHRKADAWLDDNMQYQYFKVSELFALYTEQLKITTSYDNWKQYDGYGRNWILPNIGNIKIEKITEQHLQNVINAAYKGGLAKKTLSNIRACLTAFVKFCRINKATTLVPENLSIPRGAKSKEKYILQPEDLTILFTNDYTINRQKEVPEIFINAYRFEVATGLRPGEVIGMKKTDIVNGIVNLQRSINRYGEVTSGKNDNAKRMFKLTSLAQSIVDSQFVLLKQLGIKSKYVFPNKDGAPIKQGIYYKHWVRYRDYHNMSPASPYELRHTFVSIVKCMPTGLLKQLVGHSEDMDTYGTYSHEIDGDMQRAAEQVESIFSQYI